MLKAKELNNLKKVAVNYFLEGNKDAAKTVCEGILKNAIEKRVEIGRPFSMQECEKYVGLHFTTRHTAKMSGMISISTVSGLNSRCEKNASIKGSICEKCFARKMESAGMAGKPTQILTMAMLTLCDIPEFLFPELNARYARIESFGDLENGLRAANYLKLISENCFTKFAWWTKNPDLLREGIRLYGGYTSNVQFIYSSLMINKAVNLRDIQKEYPFINKIFTVFESEKAAENAGYCVNCGKLHCLTCLKCYRNIESVIIEEVK